MLFRCYAAISGLLVASYLFWPVDLRTVPFLLVTFGAVPAVAIGLRRCPPATRLPWWLLLTALVFYDTGNVLWLWVVGVEGRSTGDGSIADLFLSAAGVFVLAAAMVVVSRRGRRDLGGVIDSVITAAAIGGLLWDAVLLPALTASGTPIGRQVALFINVLVMVGTLGAMLRISLVSAERLTAVRLLTVGIFFGLVSNVAGAVTTDPATGTRPDWTNMAFLVAYTALGCAALHPSMALVTQPGAAPKDDLTPARMTFLGLMLASVPLIGGGRVIFGLPTDGLLVALGSAGVIPLVMVRVARLAAQRRAAEQALHRLATSDGLTGLPNRVACLEHLTTELAAGADGLTVLFGDLDGFKPVNDRLGHAAGDELLVAVADRLRAFLREPDLVSRFGGDEFVIVCRGQDAAEAVCERIREMVAMPFRVGGEQVRIGFSVGLAHAVPGDSTDDLLGRADLAMYDAKKAKSVGALSLASA
jgi:diguanylate cyclase (GGDEF)-like protein